MKEAKSVLLQNGKEIPKERIFSGIRQYVPSGNTVLVKMIERFLPSMPEGNDTIHGLSWEEKKSLKTITSTQSKSLWIK